MSLYDKTEEHIPNTPLPTPSSSYINESILENSIHGLHRAVENIILSPDKVTLEDEEQHTKFNGVKTLCYNFHLRYCLIASLHIINPLINEKLIM